MIIYLDINIFRYVAYSELDLQLPTDSVPVFSNVHLNEMARTGNRDALDGIATLSACEIFEELGEHFRKTGRVLLRNFTDPHDRLTEHLAAIGSSNDLQGIIAEQLIRLFGANNFDELQSTPEAFLRHINEVSRQVPEPDRSQIMSKAEQAAELSHEAIKTHLSEQLPIDRTRSAFGLTSEHRRSIEQADDPIQEAWAAIEPQSPGITKDQLFGKAPYSFAEQLDHSQASSVAGTHATLNLLGLYPDRGLTKRDKVGNILSDGQHIGMASYCDLFITSDKQTASKARAIFKYWDTGTGVMQLVPGKTQSK
jgi:hypothetical protein